MRGIGHSDPHSDPLSDGGVSAGSGVGLSVGLTAANSLWTCTRKARADNWSGGRSGELIASLSAAFCLKARGGLCGLVYRSSSFVTRLPLSFSIARSTTTRGVHCHIPAATSNHPHLGVGAEAGMGV